MGKKSTIKRKNNSHKKIKEIREFIRTNEYNTFEHFEDRKEERQFSDKLIRRIIFEGIPHFGEGQPAGAIRFKHKKGTVVISHIDKPNGKVLSINLITVYK